MSERRKKVCDWCGLEVEHWEGSESPLPGGWIRVTILEVPTVGRMTYANRFGSSDDYCSKDCALKFLVESLRSES